MKRFMISGVAIPIVIQALLSTSAAAQATEPPPQSEEQRFEEEWIQTKLEHGESHASGMRPELGPVILGNPTQAVVVLRVGLYYSYTSTGAYSEFASLHHPSADINNTAGDAHVLDGATGKQIVAIVPGMIVHVAYDGTGYQVSVDGLPLGTFGGPIFFRPTDAANFFRVESIRRSFGGTKVPFYRGAIEIARGSSTRPSRVNVVNVVELEDYVRGVVVNESLASFQVAALKAQAVAARGYAVANIGRYRALGYPFDIVDSSSSQVYRGVISEHAKAVQAAAETTGLVASYDGRIITAFYSSSFGGHSENNEWIFNSPSSQLPGTNVTPYLRGIYDGDGVPPDFSSEAGIAAFWTVPQPSIFDDCARVGNRFSRWRIVLTGAQIKSRLTPARYLLIWGDLTGSITDVRLTTRMGASARAAIARISLTTGEVEVRGWDNLRNVLGRTAVSTPAMCAASNIAANFTLNNPSAIEVAKNLDGTVSSVTVWGGGWGHNVGLSQYGSNGRAKAGQDFLQILKAYYIGVDVGAHPIDIGRQPGAGPPTLRQQFSAPNALGTLVVRPTDLKGLRVHINETYDLSFDEADLAAGTVSVDVSPYLLSGINTIQYNPVGRDGGATVTVVIR
jgi:peptidoglycan hydrolase-like amidase